MRTLDDLVRAGTIRYIGFSNTPGWVTAQAQTTAVLRGWTPLIALQVEYSLLARTVEGELAPLALDQGMALVPWSPLKNGFLSGKYRRGVEVSDSVRAAYVGGPSDDEFVVIDAVAAIADELETTLCRSGTGLAAGPRRAPSCRSSVRAGWLTSRTTSPRSTSRCSPEHLRTLDEVSAPTLNYPAEVNGATRAMLQFAGATVDGESSTVYPPLLQSDIRY